MPSPFPGMNPYLENDAVWHDFHEAYLPALRESLVRALPQRYFVKLEEHVYVHDMSEDERHVSGRGDALVVDLAPNDAGGVAVATRPVLMVAPAQVELIAVDTERVAFLEIRDCDNDEVVTVIELLSPSNKRPGPDREQYLGRRGNLLHCAVHFVEIDLLRGWPRMPLRRLPSCDYAVMVSRWEMRPTAEAWPIKLADPLPTIPIPLRAPDLDAALDLQTALHRVHDEAGYPRFIYRRAIAPPLDAEQAAWAERLAKAVLPLS